MSETKKIVRVGSRKSQLALVQTNSVIAQLKKLGSDMDFEVVTMATIGDKILDVALSKIGEKSLFTKELEKALEDKRVDFVVHSLKDLPTVLPEGMVIGAVCKRDDPRDAVVMHPKFVDNTLDTLPKDSVIGTSSLRRAAQLKRNFPHLQFKDVRGNLNTRLKKLDDADDYAALILAVAGLERMGWHDRVTHCLEPSQCMYAVSQGAMAVECRSGDQDTLDLLSKLNDYNTLLEVVAERAFLKKLEGGCSVPVAAFTKVSDSELYLKGGIFSIDGSECVVDFAECDLPDPDEPCAKKDGTSDKPNPTTAKQRATSNGPQQFSCIVAENVSQDVLQAADKLGIDLAVKLMKAGGERILSEAKRQTAEAILKQKAQKEADIAAALKKDQEVIQFKDSNVDQPNVESGEILNRQSVIVKNGTVTLVQ